MKLQKKILDILACPKCKGSIYFKERKNLLICDLCKLGFEIKDEIPILLLEQAISIN